MALFYYTMVVFVCSLFVSAFSFSAYLLTRRKTFMYATLAYLFYFFDVALVFRTTYVPSDSPRASIFAINSPIESIILGAGYFGCLWMVVCAFLERSKRPAVISIVVYVVLSVLALVLVSSNDWHEFAFFSARGVAGMMLVIYALVYYIRTKDPVELTRIRSQAGMILAVACLSIGTTLWNVYFILIRPSMVDAGPPPFLPERNMVENIMVLAIGAWISRIAVQRLAIFYERPPEGKHSERDRYLESQKSSYAAAMCLSERETEILGLVITGTPYSRIARKLYISQSTVKVHVHNILKKTESADREALINNFWHHV